MPFPVCHGAGLRQCHAELHFLTFRSEIAAPADADVAHAFGVQNAVGILRPARELKPAQGDEGAFPARSSQRAAGLRQEIELGDRWFENDHGGRTFMHLPTRAEVLDDLAATGWTPQFDAMRRTIAPESAAVRAFSDECRFWLAQKEPVGRCPPC